MEVKIYGIDGKEKGKIKLPKVFQTKVREDIIRRAVLAIQSWRRQAYGADKLAGKRTSAHYHGRRGERWTMMGRGMSRLPRIHGDVGHLVWRARFAPQAVKGRKAHPPKPEKNWKQKINNKELLLALKSALAATVDLTLVKKRGHRYDGEVPIVLDDDFENLSKSKDVVELLKKIGLEKELERAKQKKIRSGKGKRRGRKYIKKKGPIIIVSKDCNV
ncbi:MAG: 50S ribosomal protein L4, partial [Candidatus Aenigmarchaeota archaeon]|nr:50S ribosomal protein L4 [Candidatus Aenigmarchaeota archaeon]